MEYEVVIGLEVHTEMLTESKMFCACPVLDYTQAAPNIAVCPVCAGMPGVLPVINQKAVEYAVRVGLALECEIAPVSIFARKNYFYPDLPKGYQISQFEEPLASNGRLKIQTSQGEKTIRIPARPPGRGRRQADPHGMRRRDILAGRPEPRRGGPAGDRHRAGHALGGRCGGLRPRFARHHPLCGSQFGGYVKGCDAL